jgi:predicted PurR-regulated permease PerM
MSSHETQAIVPPNLAKRGLHPERRAADPVGPAPLHPPTGEPSANPSPYSGALWVRSRMLTGLFILAVFYTMYFAQSLLIPIVLALLFNLLLAPVVRALKGYLRVPEWAGAALVLLGLAAGLIVAFYGLSGPAARWIDQLPFAVWEIEDKLGTLQEPIEEMRQAAKQVEEVAEGATAAPVEPGGEPQPVEVVVRSPSLTQTVLSGTAAVTAGLVVAVVLLYFLLASGDTLLRQAVTIAPRLRDKKRVVEIVREMEDDVSYYLLTISLINAGLGVAVGAAMFLLGMPNAILWGVMAAVLNFMPYLGALVGIGTVGLVALLTFDEPALIVLPPLTYFALTTFEAYFVTPSLLARRLTLNPVAVFLALILFTWMWGAAGALLAVPMLATFKICCDHVEALEPVGTMLGR